MASWVWNLRGWLDDRLEFLQELAHLPLEPLRRERARMRLEPADHLEADQAPVVALRQGRLRPAVGRWVALPYMAAVLAAGAAAYASGGQLPVVMAAAVVAGALAAVAERAVYDRRTLRLESQLADALDLMVAGLRAGSPLLAALQQAREESAEPLRGLLADTIGRLRLGAPPREVFSHLGARVRLESFQLFALAMAVHWDVGGSLAPSLAKIGGGVRDRIDLARRVRAMSMQARLSMLAVMAVVYFLAALMWASSPERMLAFLQSSLGTWLASVVAVLQVLGLVWAARLARFEA